MKILTFFSESLIFRSKNQILVIISNIEVKIGRNLIFQSTFPSFKSSNMLVEIFIIPVCIYLCIILTREVLFFRLFFWILVLIYPTLMANFCEFLITFCWYDRVFLRCFSIFIYCLIVILAPETTQFLFKLILLAPIVIFCVFNHFLVVIMVYYWGTFWS